MHILPLSNRLVEYKHTKTQKSRLNRNIIFQAGTAVYAGSFDPITVGHMDLIKEASKIFDKVIVLIAKNPDKQGYLSIETRKNLINECIKTLKNVSVDTFDGLTIEYAKGHNAQYLLRGVRSVADYKYEKKIKEYNENVAPDIRTIILPSRLQYNEISSSSVRSSLANGDKKFVKMVPPPVADYLCNVINIQDNESFESKLSKINNNLKNYILEYPKRIKYTWQHKKAFLKVEKELCGKNSLSGYMHDVDKLLMYMIGVPKEIAHNIHVAIAPHHIRNGKIKKPMMAVIDWECARLTKPDKPLSAREYYESYLVQNGIKIPEIMMLLDKYDL